MKDTVRATKETRVTAHVTLNGTGQADVALKGALPGSEPGVSHVEGRVAFTEHMLTAFAAWSGFDVRLHADSLDGLDHHLVEDAAITLAKALRAVVDDGRIARIGTAVVPMDDALVQVSVDLVNRPFYEGPLPDPLVDHVFRSFAMEAGLTLHVLVQRGTDPHHVVEAAFKALGVALKQATAPRAARLSTKGTVAEGGP